MGRPPKIRTPGEEDPKPVEPPVLEPAKQEPVAKTYGWILKEDGWHYVDKASDAS